MKKGWKIFWIICASLTGIGAALCIGGAVMGADFYEVERSGKLIQRLTVYMQ